MKKIIIAFICLVIVVGGIVFALSSREVEVAEVIVKQVEAKQLTGIELIWSIVNKYDLPLADKLNLMLIANSEGGFDQYAINYNADSRSFDLGHMQINTKFHPEVSRECSFNTECAIKEAVRIYQEKGVKEWSCAKNIKFFKK